MIERLEKRVIKHALALGGTVSGEHGVGVGKREHIVAEHGAHYIHLMRRIKQALDPLSIMNPDKIFHLDAPPPQPSKL
jgi:D-lactate dehydrogenase (cytochrome)